jgi:two-component system chemotaxis response regulator CheB
VGVSRCVPILALVSSVGGLEATLYILAQLPADIPAAVVTLQHMSPESESQLPHIYEGETALVVVAAQDGMPLEAGRVHVAPPGFHTLVTPARRVSLVPSGRFPPSRPSADLLLTSMALAAGAAAIAVVLTGGGSDGATGAAAVRKHGGQVLTTDESSSQSFSMPAATIARHTVSPEVLAISALPDRLQELVRELATGAPP